jgi:hypothetical protein
VAERVRDILLAVLSSLAKQEARRISERTKAGMQRARVQGTKSGKPIGRAPISAKLTENIAARLGLSRGKGPRCRPPHRQEVPCIMTTKRTCSSRGGGLAGLVEDSSMRGVKEDDLAQSLQGLFGFAL